MAERAMSACALGYEPKAWEAVVNGLLKHPGELQARSRWADDMRPPSFAPRRLALQAPPARDMRMPMPLPLRLDCECAEVTSLSRCRSHGTSRWVVLRTGTHCMAHIAWRWRWLRACMNAPSRSLTTRGGCLPLLVVQLEAPGYGRSPGSWWSACEPVSRHGRVHSQS